MCGVSLVCYENRILLDIQKSTKLTSVSIEELTSSDITCLSYFGLDSQSLCFLSKFHTYIKREVLGRWEKQGGRQGEARGRWEEEWRKGKRRERWKARALGILLLTFTSNVTKVAFPIDTWAYFKIWLADYKAVNKLALYQKSNQLPYALVIALLGFIPERWKLMFNTKSYTQMLWHLHS